MSKTSDHSVSLLRGAAGLSHRVAYALLFGISTWLFAWLPTHLVNSLVFSSVIKLVNLPVAFVSIHLPEQWQGIDLVFGSILPHSFNTSSYLWRHLRTAVPIYIVLFYLPNVLRAAGRRWLASRARTARGG